MAEIIHRRTLRPSSRLPESTYKIDVHNVGADDVVVVEIDHESNAFYRRYWFGGAVLANKNSIHFEASEISGRVTIRWTGAQPKNIPPPLVIRLQPRWFEMGYYVYVIVMQKGTAMYFYVGMTGDRKHTTARSPFYRMSGHFSQLAKSTQNQVIQALEEHWPEEKVNDLLLRMNFSYYAYKMIPFDGTNTDRHADNRRFAEAVESNVIKLLRSRFGKQNIMNKKLSSKDKTREVELIAHELMDDLTAHI